MIKSKTKLAEACGVSRATVDDWLNHDEWDFGRGPWPDDIAAKVKRWRDEVLAPNPALNPGQPRAGRDPQLAILKQRAETELAVQRAGFTKTKRKLLEDALVDRAEFETRIKELNAKLTLHLISYFPTECVRAEEERFRQLGRPLTTLEKQDIIRTKVEEALRALSGE